MQFTNSQEHSLFYFFYKLIEHRTDLDEDTNNLINKISYLESLSIMDKVSKATDFKIQILIIKL